MRLSSVMRLAARASTGSDSIFAKALVRAAAKPRPASQPQFTPQQSVTTPQWNAGTTFHPAQATNSAPFPGYGVYSMEYLQQQLQLNAESPVYGPSVPDNFETPVFDPQSHDPLQRDDLFQPVDNSTEPGLVSNEEVVDQLEAAGYEVEITELPNSDVVIFAITDSDGNSETVVVAEDGSQTTLDPKQETTREGVEEIVDGVADGQSIDEIAEAQGLTPEQVVAQLRAAGFEFESGREGEGPSYTNTTRIIDAESGDLIVSHETGPDGTQTTLIIDDDGNETRRTEHTDGSTTEEVTESNGRVTETAVDADGTTTTTVKYEQNGVSVEEVTVDDGETTTTIIDEDGNRTELAPEQDTSREGIDEIAEAVSEGKSIDTIAEEMGLTREQVEAQLAAAGFEVSEHTEPDDSVSRRIVDAETGEEIASYRFSMNAFTRSSLYIDAAGNEVRRTEYQDGRSVETRIETNDRKTVTSESADGETTVRVTHNGYTVTTPPDGDITVRREEDGAKVEVERGTPLEAMVETLMAVDLDSSDADEARAAEVVLAAVERALAGETFQELYGSDGTDGAVGEQQRALDDAIDEYGPGQQPDRNVTYENPYGDPPLEPPPSGGDWVPMYGLWMDPEVAKATAALYALEAEQLRAFAEFERSQAQLDVFALDPAYEEALRRAGNMFDEALAPQGLVWVPPKAEGALEDARERLKGAETRQEAAGEAMEEYQEVERLLNEAISAQAEMPDPPNGYVCTSEDTPADLQQNADQYEQEQSAYEAAQADVDVLFFEAGLHNAKGDEHLMDYQVSQLESLLEEVDPDSDTYEEIEEKLEEARASQEGAGIQVDTAQAYHDFHSARRDNLQLTAETYDMREQLLEAFNEDKGLLEEGKTFKRLNGKYLGEFTGQQVIEEREDGLWVVTHFEKGTTEERLAPEEMSEWWERNRDPELTETWLEHVENRQAAHEREAEAGADLHHALESSYDFTLESLDEQIADLEEELESLFKTHGQGTQEAPEELFPDDVEPQEIELGGQELLVTPDMASAFEEHGLEALKASDQPVGIMIDGERQWVHAEVAITHVALEVARDETQREILEAARDDVSNKADHYELAADSSMKLLGESDADYQARMQYDAIEEQGDEALDILYQSRFQELHAQGFDTTFRTFDEDGVGNFIEENLGLTEGREGYDDVLGAIHDVGGEWPTLRAVPLLHLDREGGMSEVVLLAVRGDDGEVRYVDGTGKHYADLADFQDHNRLFGEDGRLVVPENMEMRPSEDGVIPLDVVTARNVSVQEKIVDPLVGIGTGVATVLAFTPAAPVAAPLAYLGGAYLGYRAFEHQRNHMQRGGDWNDLESFMNYLSIATTVLPAGASGLRTIGMTRSMNVTKGEAFLASIGAVKPSSALADSANTYMRSVDGFNRWARKMDWGAIGTGTPLMGMSGYQLAVNGDQMTGLQQIDAVVGLTTGFAGTGLGIHGLSTTRPPRGNRADSPSESGGQPPAGRGGDTLPPTPEADASGVPGGTTHRPVTDETQGSQDTPATGETGNGISPTESTHDSPAFSEHGARENEGSQTVVASIKGRAEQAALFDTSTDTSEARPEGRRETLLDVTLSQLGEGSAGLATPRIVYRLDSRDPSTVFAEGFSPRFGTWNKKYTDLKEAVESHLWADDSVFVSTSSDLSVPKGAGEGNEWVYVIAEPGKGLDVDGYLGSHEWKGASEVLFDFVPSERIVGARRLGEERALRPRSKNEGENEPTWAPLYTGEFVRNPNFNSEAAASIASQAASEPGSMWQFVAQPAREVITFRLQDDQGQIVDARVLGPRAPASADNVYVQPAIGPKPRGDEPGVAGKTHVFYRDPETGEAFVMPWMRGASQNHVPSAQQTATPPQGLARLYRLGDLDALNQASTDGTLPAGHYVHIVRSSNTGLDNATFFIDGGTVPKSGRIDENGHLRWPSSQKGRPVTLSLHDQGNGQQTVRIEDATGSGASSREVTAKSGDIFIVVSSDRVTEIRAQIQGGGLPFAVYSGNGLWSVSSTVPTGQPSTATTKAAPTAQQQSTTPPQATPVTQQNVAPPSSTAGGRVSVTTDARGPIVRIHDLGGSWSSVIGQSSRKVWRSPYDRKAGNEALPETTMVRRSVLEQALAPEEVAKLPHEPYVRVSLVASSQRGGQGYTTPVHATSNDSSPARRRTARGLAAALVGGSLFGVHSASAHGWTGDVLNRAVSPESPALVINGLGFGMRGGLIFFKSRFDEKIRINREALERGEVTAERLNWEASRIITSRRALNLSKEQVARIGNVTEEFWARYQILKELPVTQESVQRGWTEDAKTQALKQATNLYRAQLKKVAGEEALTVNPLDPRTWKGVLFNSSILMTHLVNDVVSWQYLQNQWSNGELASTNLLDITSNLGLAGFLVANVVLAGSAATKVGTGLARVDLKSLPWVNKLAGTGTAIGSYFYGIMTPPWAAYTMYAAGEAMANGHWYTAGVHLAALPFQVGLSYYGIRGLRDDAISMVKSWKEGQDPSRTWPIRVLYPATTIPMAALTGTEAYNQFAQGNHLAGTALAGGTLMQMYFIDLASRRLNWMDADVRHGPFRRLTGDDRLASDGNRIWAGVGLTLAGGMLIPGALLDLRNYLEDKELLPDWEWLIADLESEDESDEPPVSEPSGTGGVPGQTEQEDTPPSPAPTPQPDGREGGFEEGRGQFSSWRWKPGFQPLGSQSQGRANPTLEEQGHDWVEADSSRSLGSIAIKQGHDITELVELNLSHIDDPGTLRPGDRIYLPKRELA